MHVKVEQVSKQYPVSEIFTESQGEGIYTGTPMTFIRLAGCTVGKPYPKGYLEGNYLDGIKQFPIYTEKCTLYDGREFPCDTDYRVHERHTPEEIIEMIPTGVDHVCITGGEPLMHDLTRLVTYLEGIGRKVHIETSGSIAIDLSSDAWVTVSPKAGVTEKMLKRADEIKLLVDAQFNPDFPISARKSAPISRANVIVYPTILAMQKPIFLQPVNGEHEINIENLKLCRMWQKKHPAFRLSLQQHKVLQLLLKEEVR